MLRDSVTGQQTRVIEADQTGIALIACAGWVRVGNGVCLPEGQPAARQEDRTRAGFGVHWQPAADLSILYGATWRSPEFQGRPEGQVVGSLKLDINS